MGIPFKKASNTGQSTTGSVSVCCWPCVCDLQEFVKADTLEVETRQGRTTLDVLVIGDPCVQSQRIPRRAPEVRCVNGRLEGATRSARDHVVIGRIQERDGEDLRGGRLHQSYRLADGPIKNLFAV